MQKKRGDMSKKKAKQTYYNHKAGFDPSGWKIIKEDKIPVSYNDLEKIRNLSDKKQVKKPK